MKNGAHTGYSVGAVTQVLNSVFTYPSLVDIWYRSQRPSEDEIILYYATLASTFLASP